MPVHDWTKVEAGIFHSFHLNWIAEINKALNGGVLPHGYYSLAEQHAGATIPDLLTLHAAAAKPSAPPRAGNGLTAVLDTPPVVARKLTIDDFKKGRPRSLAIRHVSEHRLVALIEVVSPANKDRPENVAAFVSKLVSALEYGIHAVVLDLLPPGKHDRRGLSGAIWQRLQRTRARYELPSDRPLTLASYVANNTIDIYLEHPAVGATLADMPLFLEAGYYVPLPLEASYQEAFRSMPDIYRELLCQTRGRSKRQQRP